MLINLFGLHFLIALALSLWGFCLRMRCPEKFLPIWFYRFSVYLILTNSLL